MSKPTPSSGLPWLKAQRHRAKDIGSMLGASRRFKVKTKPRGPFGVLALAREVWERGRPKRS